jgi:hypothetical protein
MWPVLWKPNTAYTEEHNLTQQNATHFNANLIQPHGTSVYYTYHKLIRHKAAQINLTLLQVIQPSLTQSNSEAHKLLNPTQQNERSSTHLNQK